MVSDKHSTFTHFPKDRNCDICLRTKITRAPCRKHTGTVVPRAENYGELITAEHKVLSERCASRHNHRYAVVVQDLTAQWIQSSPCNTKFSGDPEEPDGSRHKSLKSFTLTIPQNLASLVRNYPRIIVRQHHTDQKQMAIAERAMRRIMEGTSAVLLQSGLDKEWWADSMECFSNLRSRSLI